MSKNYLKTAWQNLRSHKAYLAINTIGLAVGIAACMLIFLLRALIIFIKTKNAFIES